MRGWRWTGPASPNARCWLTRAEDIDVLLSARRDLAATRCFFSRALLAGAVPVEVTTDRAPIYPRVLDELIPSALHTVEQYANNSVEADHGRLKARLRPMRGLKRHRSARILSAGHAFIQNLRRGHYDIATDVPPATGSARSSTSSPWRSDRSIQANAAKQRWDRPTQRCRPDHPDTITARGNLASAYHSARKLTMALPLYERTLADCERVPGADHPDTLASLGNLAHAYHTAGRLTEALTVFERTLAECERVLGPGHPLTETARENYQAAAQA